MDKANILIYLCDEDFLKYVSGTRSPLLLNPKSQDYDDYRDEQKLRFIADSKEKKVYVWSALSKTHDGVIREDLPALKADYYKEYKGGTPNPRFLIGFAKKSGRGRIAFTSHVLSYMITYRYAEIYDETDLENLEDDEGEPLNYKDFDAYVKKVLTTNWGWMKKKGLSSDKMIKSYQDVFKAEPVRRRDALYDNGLDPEMYENKI